MGPLIGIFLYLQNIQAELIEFPKDFKWCISTSAHQIEGGNHNSDWWEFEQTPGNIFNGGSSDEGVGHWDRVEEDILLMKDLGIGAYRFSIEWARIEPEKGVFDLSALNHYKNEIQLLRREGITPMMTLLHYSLPKWLADKGGFLAKSFPGHFVDFTKKIYEFLGDEVDMWITFNEILAPAAQGYLRDSWPPQFESDNDEHRLQAVFKVITNALKAHQKVYHLLHSLASNEGREISVGMVHNLSVISPVPFSLKRGLLTFLLDVLGAQVFNDSYNWSFLDALKSGVLRWSIPSIISFTEKIPGLQNTLDFIGINYYTRHHIQVNLFASSTEGKFQMVGKGELDDMAWEIYPEGIEKMLLEVHERFPHLPVYVTENGIADTSDERRIDYIKDHLKYIHSAIQKGVDVRGYCYWTLIDNFEWAHGYKMKYGLYSLDRPSMSRVPKESAGEFKKIIENNGFQVDP